MNLLKAWWVELYTPYNALPGVRTNETMFILYCLSPNVVHNFYWPHQYFGDSMPLYNLRTHFVYLHYLYITQLVQIYPQILPQSSWYFKFPFDLLIVYILLIIVINRLFSTCNIASWCWNNEYVLICLSVHPIKYGL